MRGRGAEEEEEGWRGLASRCGVVELILLLYSTSWPGRPRKTLSFFVDKSNFKLSG